MNEQLNFLGSKPKHRRTALLSVLLAIFGGILLIVFASFPDLGGENRMILMALAAALTAFGVVTRLSSTSKNATNVARQTLETNALLLKTPEIYVITNTLGTIQQFNESAQQHLKLSPTLTKNNHKTLTDILQFNTQGQQDSYRATQTALKTGRASFTLFSPLFDICIETPTKWQVDIIAIEQQLLWHFIKQTDIASPNETLSLSIFRTVPIGMAMLDAQGRIIDCNTALQHLLGSCPKQAFLSDILRSSHNNIPKTLDAGDSFTTQAITKNEQNVQITLIDQMAVGETYTTLMYFERLPSAGVMQESHAEIFFDSAPIAVAIAKFDGTILRANTIMSDLLNGSAQAGKPLSGIAQTEKEREKLAQAIASLANGNVLKEPLEVTLNAKDTTIIAQVYLYRTSGMDEDVIFSYFLDITEQRKLETQFAQTQKMAAINGLAGGIAHDFNNLLTTIIGNCDLLTDRHSPNDPSFIEISQIRNQANRAAALTSKLLAFARQQTLRPRVVQLTDEISEIQELLRRALGEKITLQVDHARNLWPVHIDTNEFERVITNLALNAKDAMQGAGELHIRTRNFSAEQVKQLNSSFIPDSDFVLIEVADTGTGIAPEVIGQIFDPFFSTKGSKGHGLGLSSVYGIIKQMHGFILPENTPEGGAVFKIYLPRSDGKVERASVNIKAEQQAQDISGEGKILLVEDEDALRAMSAKALSSRGYTVLQAGSAEAALEIMKSSGEDIRLIISDVVLPNMDGPTLLQKIRELNLSAKVILISGYAEEAFRKHLRGDEEFVFIPKPFSLRELALKVKQTIGE